MKDRTAKISRYAFKVAFGGIKLKYTRRDSNPQPSVPKTIRALISLSQRFRKARFYEAFSITTLRQCVHQMQILGVSGGISGGNGSRQFLFEPSMVDGDRVAWPKLFAVTKEAISDLVTADSRV